MKASLLLPVLLLLAACGSGPPPKFHSLAALPPEGAKSGKTLAAPVTFSAVHIPPFLDRSELVRQSASTEVTIDSQERWAAPLADMIREVLSQDVAARLAADQVVPPDAPAPAETRRIVVTIIKFTPDQHGETRLAGDWSMLSDDGKSPAMRRDFAFDLQASGPGGAGQAEAMSRALGQLADSITGALPAKGGS